MTSTWFGKDTWRAADQGEGGEYSGGSGSDGGWPALGGLMEAKAGVEGSPPKKDFGPVGAERKFGLVKPVGGGSLKVSGGGGAGAIGKIGGVGGGGPHERAWKEILKASTNPEVPLGKSLLSVEGAGGSRTRTTSSILGARQFNRDEKKANYPHPPGLWKEILKASANPEVPLGKSILSREGVGGSRTTSSILGARQFNRDEKKANYPPGLWGALGMKTTKEPGEPGHGVSSKLNWGQDLLRSNEASHVREVGFNPMGMGGAVAGPLKYSDSAPYGGRSPLINESYGFSSLAAPSSNRCDGSCLSRINDAYLKGFLAGRRSMVMQPPVPSMPSPIIPSGGSSLLDFDEPDRNSGFHSLFSDSAAKPPTTFTSQQGRWFEALSHDNFKNFVPVTPPKLAQADGRVAFGTGCELGDGASRITSRSSSGDDQLPDSGFNSWSASCENTAKGENDPLKR